MEEKVLKAVTVLTGIFTLVVGISLQFLPNLHEQEALAAEKRQEIGRADLVTSADPKDVVERADNISAQLKIGLPQQLLEQQLTIENDYLTQTVYIRFRGGVDDYFEQYAIQGSCDHIASLFYYKDGDEGVIALGLDRVYELEETFEQGNLYLDFVDPHTIYDKVVVIDAGHGDRAPGAVKLGIAEKDIDLSILLELRKLLDDCPDNIGVYYTRTSDTNPTLEQRVQLANKADADLFISIHNNSDVTGNFTKTKGTLVMYSESSESELSGKKLAQICQDNLTDTLGSENRGLLGGDKIYIIRNSEVPAALVEVGFMTNYEELVQLNTKEYQQKAAKGIYRAIMEAFQEGY